MTFDGIELGFLVCSNNDTIDGKFEVFLLCSWLGRVLGLYPSTNGGSEIGLRDEIYLETILCSVDGLLLGTCDSTVIVPLEGLIDGSVVGNYLCLCCCRGYVHM